MDNVRRRLTSGSVPADVSNNAAIQRGHALVERGLALYQELELTDFQDRSKLEECSKCFLQAAENGSDEAVDWIRNFLESLPVSNELSSSTLNLLRWFAQANESEKQVRRTAKRIFMLISDDGKPIAKSRIKESVERLFSDRSDRISSADLMKASVQLKSSVTHLLHASLVLAEADEVAEETFVKAAQKYVKGKYLSADISSLTPDKLEDFKKANFVKRVYDYPWQTVYYTKRFILKTIERYGVKWIWYYLPMKQLYLLILAYILPMLNISFIFSTACSVVLAIAFFAMCISTLQTINNSDKFSNFRQYSSVFQYFSELSDKINTQIPETKLIQRSYGPYVTFLVCAVFTIFTAPLAHKIPFMLESLGVVAGIFAVIVFLYFECWKSPLILAAVFSRTASWVFIFNHLLGNYIPIFATSIGEILSGGILPGFPVDINLITLIQVPLQVVLVLKCLVTKRWYNLYEGLGPYLLFIVYWLFFRKFIMLSSPLYFLLALAGLCMFCSLVPFLPLIALASPLVFLVLYGVSMQFFVASFLLTITLLAIIFIYMYFNQIREAKWLRIPFEYVILIMVLAALPATYFVASGYSKVYAVSAVPSVSLTDYAQYCTNRNDRNMVQAQLDCLHLQGRMLSASGLIGSVKISHVTNPKAESLQSLPGGVRDALTCLLGDTEPVCGNRKDMATCINTGCHLGRYNLYEFEVEIKFPTLKNGTNLVSAVLVASDRFLDVMRNLTTNVTLHFNATFVAGMGSDQIKLKLSSLLWNDVLYVEQIRETFDAYSLLANIWLATKGTLLFVIETIIGFTPASSR
eukprot:Em0013g47a